MKKLFLFLFTILISVSCGKTNGKYTNPYLPSQSVNFSLYLNDPAAINLLNPGGVYVAYGVGNSISGIAIYNAGAQYFAYELTCPNHKPEGCSVLTRKDNKGIFVYCSCKHNHDGVQAQFSLINGQSLTPGVQYQLKPYPVRKQGDYLHINY
ncbi:hypothetical protein LNQ81_04025 [Myroides sp. M-43]|uniref:Rieske (2Fe-2S) protein n=1 Tax=Myroides oncorhynchi TaxID=2893756 RepID=UPI001E417B2A|nr:hypothetical protein [Myroides oncorhynchi]MCC9041868.1 hypothetical protein [Myroides oncorhynchi]